MYNEVLLTYLGEGSAEPTLAVLRQIDTFELGHTPACMHVHVCTRVRMHTCVHVCACTHASLRSATHSALIACRTGDKVRSVLIRARSGSELAPAGSMTPVR